MRAPRCAFTVSPVLAALTAGAIAWLAGCLDERPLSCDDGGTCPAGLQCAHTGDAAVCILPTCGNGHLDPGETCDDGNTRSGDGCPADCRLPCGNGVLDPGEICDDGNTVDDGCSADCRSQSFVSPATVTFTANEGDLPPTGVTVIVRHVDQGGFVLFGYPPGAANPSWLSIAEEPSGVIPGGFTVRALDTSTVGKRSTSVRFLLRRQNGTDAVSVDVPVDYTVAPSDVSVHATPAALAFTATVGGTVPQPGIVDLAFNGSDATMANAPSWVTVYDRGAPGQGTASFTVYVNTTALAAGAYSGDIVFATTKGPIRSVTTVHVDYALVANTPELRFVAPYLGIAGRGGRLHARGAGFLRLGSPITLGVGDHLIGPVSPDSDSQVTLSYPPLPEGRYPVTFDSSPGTPTRAELVIVAPPAMTYQAIEAPGRLGRLVYDAERQAIYGTNLLDQQIEHFVYTGGSWSRIPPHVIPQLTDIAMAPDGRSLVVLDKDAINEMSLTDGMFVPVQRRGNPDPFCGGFFDQVVPADDGKFFVVFDFGACSGSTPSYLYDMVDHSLLFGTWLYNGLAGASADGSRIYACTNGLFPPETVVTYDSLSGTTSDSTADLNLYAVSVSGDASRVILQNTLVYSRSLRLIGNVPDHGATLASRDSSRAFVYAVDAAGARLEIYDLNGPLQAGALYPLLRTVTLPDTANSAGDLYGGVTMASSLDDAVVVIAGSSKLLVVPVN